MDRQQGNEKQVESKTIETNSVGTRPSGKSLIFDGFVMFCTILILIALLQNAELL